MKKHYFIKEYLYHSDFESKSSGVLATVEVDYGQIERNLPLGASIKYETVHTMLENGKLIVYGEYTLPLTTLEEVVMKESIDIDQVLGEEGLQPSVN